MRAFVAISLLWGCAPHGPVLTGPIAAEVYEIDGQSVDLASWQSWIAHLVGPQKHWSCAETDRGGITRWSQVDDRGGVWEIEEVSDSEGPEVHRARRVTEAP